MKLDAPHSPPITMAASMLLLSARATPQLLFSATDADRMLHQSLRFSERGPNARIVDPVEAVEELIRSGFAVGTSESWGLA